MDLLKTVLSPLGVGHNSIQDTFVRLSSRHTRLCLETAYTNSWFLFVRSLLLCVQTEMGCNWWHSRNGTACVEDGVEWIHRL